MRIGKLLSTLLLLMEAFTMLGPICALAQETPPQSQDDKEWLFKAGIITKFPNYVDWPEKAFTDNGSKNFIIGVLGDTPIVKHLKEVTINKTLKQREVEIRQINTLKDIEKTHILYIPSSQEACLKTILNKVKGLPILTVGDAPSFGIKGTVVNLYKTGDNIRFEINVAAQKQQEMQISYKLLNLSPVVHSTITDIPVDQTCPLN